MFVYVYIHIRSFDAYPYEIHIGTLFKGLGNFPPEVSFLQASLRRQKLPTLATYTSAPRKSVHYVSLYDI